jgi:DNA-binding NtrC family response regulator
MSEPSARTKRAELKSARVLLAEDDFIILMQVETTLAEAGARIVGACGTVEAALTVATLSDINAALLDMRLGRETIAPVARCLARRGIPFAFYTAQAPTDSIKSEWPDTVMLEQPASPEAIVAAVAGLLRPD